MPFLAARLLEASWAAQAVQAAWRLRKLVQLWLERARVIGVAGFLLMDAHEVFFMDFWMDFPASGWSCAGRWVPSRKQPWLKVRGHNTNFGTSKRPWNFGSVNLYRLQTLVSQVCFFEAADPETLGWNHGHIMFHHETIGATLPWIKCPFCGWLKPQLWLIRRFLLPKLVWPNIIR